MRLRSLLLTLVLLVSTAVVAAADDFWLVPNAFRIAAGRDLVIRGQTSSLFPTSRVAVTVERIADGKRIGADGVAPLGGLSVDGTSLMIRERPPQPGQYAIAVVLHPRSVRESSAGFRRYLVAEGAAAALDRIDREGLLGGRDSVTRRYAKYAKTLVEVGTGGPRAFDRRAGHVLELVPLRDPAALSVGDTLGVRLLFRGAPLSGVIVHRDVVAFDAAREASGPGGHAAPAADASFTTDASGLIRVPITAGGMWSVRTIHVEQAAAGSGADWDTHWATIVFAVGAPPPSP